MKTAVIYARYSSDSQTEQSIEGQLRVCREYAERNDILIVDTYIDRAMSGTNDNRPSFQKMIQDSNRKAWTYVLVYKLDRFSRNKYEMAMHKKTLKDNGTKVLSATEFIPDTPEGIIFESMLEGYAEYYSAELSQKIRRGNNESRRKGNLTGGIIPFGYKNVDKKAVIVEENAAIVRYIYSQYAMGVYVKDIIFDLTKRGITHYGKPFVSNTVYKILKNERYSGIYRHNGETFDNIYPQIVPKALFDAVQAKVKKNKYGKRSIRVTYLLSGMLKCGLCGANMGAECGTAKNGTVKNYYKCLGRKHGSNCKKSTIGKELLEKIVVDNVIEELSKPQILDALTTHLLAMQEKLVRENPMLAMLENEKRKVDTALGNLLLAIERGIFSNTTNKRLHDLELRQEDLSQEILIEKSKMTIKLTAADISKYFKQALLESSQILISTLIKEVVLYDDKIEIHYNNPLTCPDESRGFSFVYKTVTFSPIAYCSPQQFVLEMLI